ncbi:hypothetical protein BDP27DRAFT_1422456 [Rhodocollybia butyracea]|uniref:Uncharacterized protein n=1 Tax=Rhodocollybia butyracea TaxID=206335 RepID=A0A9P5U7F7_9AGAR|nr:hypothetical protein BDP27DRAFT_1422456 [Rhodocollybia butyracea]
MPSVLTLTALSILLTLCTLSAQATNTQGLTTRQTKTPNPFAITNFGLGAKALVIATSHASFVQRVNTTVFGADPIATCILQGNGEGVDMVVLNSSPPTTQCVLVGTSLSATIRFLFQFSSAGAGGPFVNTPIVQALVTAVGTTTMVSAQTEDSTDNDLNDSVVSALVQGSPSGLAVPQVVNSASLESTLVESDLFFRPTDNITVSVRAFSGESTLSEFSASTQDWGKVTGEIIDINQEPIFPNLLVMRFLFSESTSEQPEMQNATLLLNGIVTFRGARPTGTPTSGVGWISDLILGDLE